ncbi:hypothetical protein [Verrucomicrobium spinosum]|nr:hypothetical protein [Verrucomicrobium spinosum]
MPPPLELRELNMDEVNGRMIIEPSPYPLVPERMEPKKPSPKKKP